MGRDRLPTGCRWAGCRKLVRGRYCARHEAAARKAVPQTSPVNTARWQRLRKMVIAEEPTCRECRKHHHLSLTQVVDHIIPRQRGGTDDRDNLQGLCRPHHDEKTAAELGRQAGAIFKGRLTALDVAKPARRRSSPA